MTHKRILFKQTILFANYSISVGTVKNEFNIFVKLISFSNTISNENIIFTLIVYFVINLTKKT